LVRRKRSVVTQTRPIRSPVGTDTADDGVASMPAGDGPMGNGGDGAGDSSTDHEIYTGLRRDQETKYV
jgi:hypothetical protein